MEWAHWPVWDSQTVLKQTKYYSFHIYGHFQCLRISEFANGQGFMSDSYQEKQSLYKRTERKRETDLCFWMDKDEEEQWFNRNDSKV